MKKLASKDIKRIGQMLEAEYGQTLTWTFGFTGIDYNEDSSNEKNENFAKIINKYLAGDDKLVINYTKKSLYNY